MLFFLFQSFVSHAQQVDSNDEMVKILSEKHKKYSIRFNLFCPEAKIAYYDSIILTTKDKYIKIDAFYYKALSLLDYGKENEAVALLENLKIQVDSSTSFYNFILKALAMGYMRLGERQNCVNSHSSESCIMPIIGSGVHQLKMGSLKAIELYEYLLKKNPTDYESMWVLNIAYMTLGKYPNNVPKQWLISGLDKNDSLFEVKPFIDVAADIGFNYRNCAGGLIVEDFNNDNYLDIVTSDWNLTGHMHFLLNDKTGGFQDISKASNLGKFTGGLNMIHADYDNDGYNDIMVLRGGWTDIYGEQPNSLLKNNGDNTFTDVTKKSGLYSECPTQTGVWRDFNNDGWLDLFIGNESSEKSYPCQLYINNKDGTFTECAALAMCDLVKFVKGVSAADFDNDGLQDIVISSFEGRLLLKNMGVNENNIPLFSMLNAGLNDLEDIQTFPTWFFDYDNDGWQDIFVGGYKTDKSMAYNLAVDALGFQNKGSKLYLYHNNQDGTFTNVSVQARINKAVFPMGSNFGDIDNDGYLDMYLGTGNPLFSSLMPNKLFRNMGNGVYADVTVSARVGNLQKGHGVVVLDIDNDGDEDILEEIGGAYVGDAFMNSLYLNSGQNNNNWISIALQGTETNRSAIGSHLKLTFIENGIKRSIYRDVNSGGSFGSASFRRDIGIGTADIIDELLIIWANGKTETFKNIKPNQFIKIVEGKNSFTTFFLNKLDFQSNKSKAHHHCEE